jgi:hypothetical protein
VSVYEHDGQRIIAEGTLRNDRDQPFHTVTGGTHPAGVLHHMAVRLLVNCATLQIEDAEAELICVPRDECRETADSLACIKGLTVTRGFTAKVKSLAGGSRGCTHLVELLTAMAPAVFQGFAAHHSRKPEARGQEHARRILRYLVNTCHAWRDDGPFVASLRKKLQGKPADPQGGAGEGLPVEGMGAEQRRALSRPSPEKWSEFKQGEEE